MPCARLWTGAKTSAQPGREGLGLWTMRKSPGCQGQRSGSSGWKTSPRLLRIAKAKTAKNCQSMVIIQSRPICSWLIFTIASQFFAENCRQGRVPATSTQPCTTSGSPKANPGLPWGPKHICTVTSSWHWWGWGETSAKNDSYKNSQMSLPQPGSYPFLDQDCFLTITCKNFS